MNILVASDGRRCPEKMAHARRIHPDETLYLSLGGYLNGWTGLKNRDDMVFKADGHKLFVSFGDKIPCHTLARRAQAAGCDVLLWGDNPNAWIVDIDGVLFVSPGSIDHPCNSMPAAYARIQLEKGQAPKAALCFEER